MKTKQEFGYFLYMYLFIIYLFMFYLFIYFGRGSVLATFSLCLLTAAVFAVYNIAKEKSVNASSQLSQ